MPGILIIRFQYYPGCVRTLFQWSSTVAVSSTSAPETGTLRQTPEEVAAFEAAGCTLHDSCISLAVQHCNFRRTYRWYGTADSWKAYCRETSGTGCAMFRPTCRAVVRRNSRFLLPRYCLLRRSRRRRVFRRRTTPIVRSTSPAIGYSMQNST